MKTEDKTHIEVDMTDGQTEDIGENDRLRPTNDEANAPGYNGRVISENNDLVEDETEVSMNNAADDETELEHVNVSSTQVTNVACHSSSTTDANCSESCAKGRHEFYRHSLNTSDRESHLEMDTALELETDSPTGHVQVTSCCDIMSGLCNNSNSKLQSLAVPGNADISFKGCILDKPKGLEDSFSKSPFQEVFVLGQDIPEIDRDLLNLIVFPVTRPVGVSHSTRFEPLMTIINKISSGERVPPQITMKYEMLRFCTLRSFPKVDKPYITRLAQAGFYFASSGDEAVCYCCGRRKHNWRADDDPMEVHRTMNPNCRFLLNNSEVNVPIRHLDDGEGSKISPPDVSISQHESSTGNSSLSSQQSTRPKSSSASNTDEECTTNTSSVDVSGRRLESSAQNSSSNTKQSSAPPSTGENNSNTSASRSSGHTLTESSPGTSLAAVCEEQTSEHRHSTLTVASGDGGKKQLFSPNSVDRPGSRIESQSRSVVEGEGRASSSPKYPTYVSLEVRQTSFVACGDIAITPDRLSETGFYYAGFGDCVRCFHCGVGLRHWSAEDDPWIEHSRWSKDCAYVKQMKGEEFVNLVQLAVQYSQNETRGGQTVSRDNPASEEQQTPTEVDEISRLMHTDGAQSVLEMGYSPDIIRRAIRLVLDTTGRESLRAATIMDKIFEIEAVEDPSSVPNDDEPTGNMDNGEQGECGTTVSTAVSRDSVLANSNTIEGNQGPNPNAGEQSRGNNIEGDERHETNTQKQVTETQKNSEDNRTDRKTTVNDEEPADTDRTVSAVGGAAAPSVVGQASGGASLTRGSRPHLSEQKRLKKENDMLKKQSICTKCNNKDICIVFLPCGHLVTCEDCAPTVKYCNVESCGKYIKGTVRTYMT